MEFDIDNHDDLSAIPRDLLFVLVDGTFVVRWSENRVQELQSHQYRAYANSDFGAPITDYELNQLKDAGLVAGFDEDKVWLHPLPEQSDLGELTAWEQNRVRSFYLNTTLPGSLLSDVVDLLEDLGLSESFQARVRDDFVVLWGSKGLAFQKFDDAEKSRLLLASKVPEAFENTVVAFVETSRI